MAWYLVFRALCVVAFIASALSVCCAAGFSERASLRLSGAWMVIALVLAVTGCLLVGVGWSEAHPEAAI